jgi:hypothetical protein
MICFDFCAQRLVASEVWHSRNQDGDRLTQILHHSQEDVFPAFLTISLPRPELKVRANRGKSTEVDWKTQVVDRQSV